MFPLVGVEVFLYPYLGYIIVCNTPRRYPLFLVGYKWFFLSYGVSILGFCVYSVYGVVGRLIISLLYCFVNNGSI